MQEWRDKSEIHIYQRIQLSNNKFINGILGVRWLDLAWLQSPRAICESHHAAVGFQTKVPHFWVKNTSLKDTNEN